jgi:hypothetical protein
MIMTLKDVMIEDIDLGITKTNELIKQINLIEKLNDKDGLTDLLNKNVLFTFSRLRQLIIADNAENLNFLKHYRDVWIVYGQVYDRVDKEIKDNKKKAETFKPIRESGTKKNKELAYKNHAVVLEINNELLEMKSEALKNLKTARWGLKQRAKYIYKQIVDRNICREYSVSYIEKIIAGT